MHVARRRPRSRAPGGEAFRPHLVDLSPMSLLPPELAEVYMVFAYETFGGSHARYLVGLYGDPAEAERRQVGWSQSHPEQTVFICRFPYGDGATEMFTTGYGVPHQRGRPSYASS